jgi:hypothetical protein
VHPRTAASTSVSRQTTEMRISEVLISSRLTPASASAPKNRADTPGCERIPAPTSDTLPMFWSKSTLAKPTVCFTRSSAASAVGPSLLGSVNEMSASLLAVVETFCTIMSMLISASASTRKICAASPGRSGTP